MLDSLLSIMCRATDFIQRLRETRDAIRDLGWLGCITAIWRFMKPVGFRCFVIADEVRELTNGFAASITATAGDLQSYSTEQLVPVLQPYFQEAVELVQTHWKQSGLALLQNDSFVKAFAKFTYGFFPDPVRSVLKKTKYVTAVMYCRDILVQRLTDPNAGPQAMTATA